ncbi:ParB/RepB/Spo0J family partition protein [bacterium]|nr:ParB/RepB/Spo0J family partition protein [bacterium]
MVLKKNSLGRGLSALIPTMEDEPSKEFNSVSNISVDEIKPNPYQPRKYFDPEMLEDLRQSIKEKGIIQPITVRKVLPDGYELISGERRLRAVKSLAMETIPAYILSVNSMEEMLEIAIIENIQRDDLNPIEIADAYQKLIEDCNLTQEQVSQKVGKDRSTITNFLRLLRLPREIQESIIKNEITMGKAKPLIAIEDRETQLELWRKSIDENLNARVVEELVREINQKEKTKEKQKDTQKSEFILKLESRIKSILAVPKVEVKAKNKGGEITIAYKTEEELEKIMSFFAEGN